MKQGLGLENCLDTFRFLGNYSVPNVFKCKECRCRLRVEQPVLEVFCFDDNDALTQFQVEFSNCRVDILVARIFLETINLAVTWGGPFGRKRILF